MNTVTSKDGTSIAFDRSGEGAAVILVGGAIQHRAIDPSTARLAELLSSTFTVVHYDRRGRGDSGDTAPYAVEREIEDIDALIQDAGGSASLFGMSSGAVLSLDAADRGLGITKLALYEPPLMVDDSRPPVPQDYRERLSAMLSEGRRGDAVELFMTEAVGLPAEAVSPMRGAPFWPGLESVAHTLPYDDAIMGDLTSGKPLPAARWARVTIPTLVIDGGESPAWARNAVQAIVDVLPQAHTPHAGWPDAPGRPGGPRTRAGWVPRRVDPPGQGSIDRIRAVVLGGHLLRHHHPPRVEHQFAHLRHVDGRQMDLDPVEPHVRRAWHEELLGLGRHQRLAFLLREPETHLGLVARERQEHDLTDPELHAVADEHLVAPWKRRGQRANVLDRGHRVRLSCPTDMTDSGGRGMKQRDGPAPAGAEDLDRGEGSDDDRSLMRRAGHRTSVARRRPAK